jgi:hypothetical protein
VAALVHDPAMQGRVHMAFRFAFLGAAVLCLVSAWTASRVPTLHFSEESGRTRAVVE